MPYVEYDEVEAVCSECGRAFRSEEALTEHQAEAHAGSVTTERSTTKSPMVTCSLCQKRFRSANALREHNRRDHNA
jgi:uncharacterized Zn-finger protein